MLNLENGDAEETGSCILMGDLNARIGELL